ncbi:MAG: hypothetical protein ACREAC_04195, partial [Blastocatellia bacterium]
IGMIGGGDPDNRRDFPGGFPGDPKDAFTAAGRTPEQEQVFNHVRQLGELRKHLPPLRRGKMIDLFSGQHQYAYARVTKDSSVIVVLNNGAGRAQVSFDVSLAGLPNGAMLEDRLGGSHSVKVENGKIETEIAPYSAAIYTAR